MHENSHRVIVSGVKSIFGFEIIEDKNFRDHEPITTFPAFNRGGGRITPRRGHSTHARAHTQGHFRGSDLSMLLQHSARNHSPSRYGAKM